MTDINKQIQHCKNKIANLRFELAVEQAVLGRLQALSPNQSRSDSGSAPQVMSGSLAEQIVSLLREKSKSMRPTDITSVLTKRGVTTTSKRGLLPMVISALRRRQDVFYRVRRGVYKLTEGGEGNVAAKINT